MLYVGNQQLPQYLFMVASIICIGFTFTYLFGYDDSMLDTPVEAEDLLHKKTQEERTGAPATERTDEKYISPIVGEVVALSGVNDPVFSSGLWDKGLQ